MKGRMRKLLPFLALVALIGCTTFSTSVFRAEKLTADGGVAAVKAFNAWARVQTNDCEVGSMQADVWEASRHLAASLAVLEQLRVGYATNAATTDQVNAALLTVTQQGSNLVWLCTYFKQGSYVVKVK